MVLKCQVEPKRQLVKADSCWLLILAQKAPFEGEETEQAAIGSRKRECPFEGGNCCDFLLSLAS